MSRTTRILLILNLGLTVSPRLPASARTTVFYDDFEVVPVEWSFRQSGSHGSQVVTRETAHQGKSCLQSKTDRLGLDNIRSGFRYRDKQSRLSFWYFADYSSQESPDALLTIGLRCADDGRVLTTRLRKPPPRQWQFVELAATDVSPLLAGKWIDQLHVGLRGRAAPLRMHLDEIRMENEVPATRVRTPQGKTQAVPARWSPLKCDTLRAAAFSPSSVSPARAKELADAGFNAFFIMRPSERELVQWVGLGQKNGASVFAVVPMFYDVTEYLEKGQLRRAVFADGVADCLLCPFQETYWDRILTPIFERWAELSKTIPLAGILIDASATGSIHLSYSSVDSCFCDECFSRFLERSNIKESVVSFPQTQRREWLLSNSLLLSYFDILRRRLDIRSEILCSRLQKVNPQLMLGLFGFDESWLGMGTLQGLHRPEAEPILAAREPTIRGGYSIAVAWDSQRLHRAEIPHRWLAGFDPHVFSASELSEHVFAAGREAQGYWVELDGLFTEEAKEGTATSFRSSPQAILEAIRKANQRLDSLQPAHRRVREGRHRPSPPVGKRKD